MPPVELYEDGRVGEPLPQVSKGKVNGGVPSTYKELHLSSHQTLDTDLWSAIITLWNGCRTIWKVIPLVLLWDVSVEWPYFFGVCSLCALCSCLLNVSSLNSSHFSFFPKFLRVDQDKDRDCSLDCPSSPQKPLCASDGRTFLSRCEFQRAKCKDPQLEIAHRGNCKGEPQRPWPEDGAYVARA